MSETFDPVSGVLRVSQRTLGALVALHQGGDLAPEEHHRLTELGLAREGKVDLRVAGVASVLSGAPIRLSLDVIGSSRVHVDGWVDEQAAVLVMGSPTVDTQNIVMVPVEILPLQLARLFGLKPQARPKVTDPVELDSALVETLLGSDAAVTKDQVDALTAGEGLIAELVEALAAFSHAESFRWRVGCWWDSPDQSPEARELQVIDSASGRYLVTPLPRGPQAFARVQLRPVSATAIWRLLCSLLPDGGETLRPRSS